MAFSIYTFSNKVRNLVNKNNTTTSGFDISSGLNKRVTKVIMGFHSKKPQQNIQYPLVWVEPRVKIDEFASLGNNAKREMTIRYEVTGIVQGGMGAFDGREQSDNEMLKLSANLETLFRNYIDLSNSSEVMSSILESIEYDVIEFNDTWNSICKLNLEAKVRSD